LPPIAHERRKHETLSTKHETKANSFKLQCQKREFLRFDH
jgi:hypothetical protein